MFNPLRRWKIMGQYRHLRRARWPMHKLFAAFLFKAALVLIVCSPVYVLFFLFHIIGYIAELVVNVLELLPSSLFRFIGGFDQEDRFDSFLIKEGRWKRRVLKLK